MRNKKFFIIVCTAFYMAVFPVFSWGDEGVKSATKDAIKSIGEFGKNIGKSAKKAGIAVGLGFKEAGKKTGEVGKDVGKGVKEGVKETVKK